MQAARVSAGTAAPVVTISRCRSAATFDTASAMGEFCTSISRSAPASYAWVASPGARAGLLWSFSASTTTGRPSTVPPKSATAILTASTPPRPDRAS